MKKDTLTQFVCFTTQLELETFAPEWERFVNKLSDKTPDPSLQQQVAGTKARFRYISQHELPDPDFNFRFMNDRKSEQFPEMQVRVTQIGGYIPIWHKKKIDTDETYVKLIAFISHNETDIEFYRRLPVNGQIDIYQAYYESCSYGYVLEFFVPETDAGELFLQLKLRPGVETGIYKDCFVPHI